jgi:hypothetical protein
MIIRRKHNGNFTVIGNGLVENEALSAEALGVLCYLLSRPDNWQVIPDQLQTRFNVGRDKMYRVLSELIDLGYISRSQAKDPENHIFGKSEYVVYDEPRPEKADTGPRPCFPRPEKPRPEKADTIIRTDRQPELKEKQELILTGDEPPNPKPKRAKARTPLPEGWTVDGADSAHAAGLNFTPEMIRSMGEAFADYHQARGNMMADWHAAWRTWCANQIKYHGRNGSSVQSPRPRGSGFGGKLTFGDIARMGGDE